jgi:hypothetical protein
LRVISGYFILFSFWGLQYAYHQYFCNKKTGFGKFISMRRTKVEIIIGTAKKKKMGTLKTGQVYKARRAVSRQPNLFLNLKSNTMKNTLQR